MDNYVIYIWPAYIITLGVLGLNLILAIIEKHKTLRLLKNIIPKNKGQPNAT